MLIHALEVTFLYKFLYKMIDKAYSLYYNAWFINLRLMKSYILIHTVEND